MNIVEVRSLTLLGLVSRPRPPVRPKVSLLGLVSRPRPPGATFVGAGLPTTPPGATEGFLSAPAVRPAVKCRRGRETRTEL